MKLYIPDRDPTKTLLIRIRTPELMEEMFEKIFPEDNKPIYNSLFYWCQRREDTALSFRSGQWNLVSYQICWAQQDRFQFFDAEELLAIQSVNKESFLHLI